MKLSEDAAFVYILADSGVRGRLTSGRIERDPSGQPTVFDAYGGCIQYLSGNRLRSWCVVGPQGRPIDGWQEIQAADLPKILRA